MRKISVESITDDIFINNRNITKNTIKESIKAIDYLITMRTAYYDNLRVIRPVVSIKNVPLLTYSMNRSNVNSLYNNGIIRLKVYNLLQEVLADFPLINTSGLMTINKILKGI